MQVSAKRVDSLKVSSVRTTCLWTSCRRMAKKQGRRPVSAQLGGGAGARKRAAPGRAHRVNGGVGASTYLGKTPTAALLCSWFIRTSNAGISFLSLSNIHDHENFARTIHLSFFGGNLCPVV